MANQFPPDHFDTLPDDLARVGAHRAPARKGRGWIAFAWAALATGILVAGGVVGLALFTDAINIDLAPQSSASPSPSASAPPVVEPVLDPAIVITVLNGTTTSGLANAVGDYLVAQGWGGAATGVGSRANAGSLDVEKTVVFYSDPINEAAALAMVQTLGGGEARLSNDYPTSPLTVLIGSDYTLPAG